MFFDWKIFFKKFLRKVIIWTFSGLIWNERRNFKKFPILEAIGHLLDRYEVERRKMIFFIVQLNKRHSAVPIWSEKRKNEFFRFQLNKQLFAGQIWCGRRKRIKFLDLVMKSPVAVPIWCRKRNLFSKMEAKSRFHSLYGAKEEKTIFFKINLANSTFRSLYDVKRRLYFLQQIRLSCPYMVWKEENEAIFAKIHRSICTNSVKGNFFFQLFFDN